MMMMIYVYEHFMNIMSISHIRIIGMLQSWSRHENEITHISINFKKKNRNSEQQNEKRRSLAPFFWHSVCIYVFGDVRGIMVIVVGNEPGDTSSNPGRD